LVLTEGAGRVDGGGAVALRFFLFFLSPFPYCEARILQ
jgi:hypothetical protein